MRIIKNIAWILSLYVIQTVFGRFIKINETVPNLLAAYSVITAFLAASEKEMIYVLLLCGIISGSSVGHIFCSDVFIIGTMSILSHAAAEYVRFVPGFVRALIMCLAAAALLAAAECLAVNHTIGINDVLHSILPYTAYTLAAACIIYPLIVKTLFKKKDKKLMVI